MSAPENPSEPAPSAGPAADGLPERTPDHVEQAEGDGIDDPIPRRGYGELPVVGLGGSAGGLAALQTFFGAMPRDSGMVFVVVMHLSPEHDSILAELLQRMTAMPVFQVQSRVKVEINHVYVIPPAKHLSMDDGHLILSEMEPRTGKHVAVDLFFRTLADAHGAHAAAIVLSGADGDGASGIKRVKERGGLTIAQEPGEAEQDSMPRASISTGMVDWVLPVAEMPARLCEYWRAGSRRQLSWVQAHYEFIEPLAPPSVIVNQNHDILHLSEHAGRFLHVTGGAPTTNLLRLVHPMLRIELRASLYRAAQTGQPVETRDVPVELDGAQRKVNLCVVPSRSVPLDCLLVVFREQAAAAEAAPGANTAGGERNSALRLLEGKLVQSKGLLHDTIAEADASREELQAMNEELRSTTEELETGRAQLQSINEELSTVNQELKSKVEKLGHSSGDLQNLMAATQIATVFLDRDLCIQRYTSPAGALFNLIPTDVGRPLSDLTPPLDYPNLATDAASVLDRLTAIETEVAHRDGRYFLARMLPYRTTEDYIAGVALTFVDITVRRHAEEESRTTEARFRAVADLVPDLLFSTDAAGQLLWCNRRWLDYSGKSLAQSQGYGWIELIHPEDRARVRHSFLEAVRQGKPYRNEHRLLGADGRARWFLVRAEALRDAEGRITQWFGAKTDVEDLKRATSELASSQEQLRLLVENAREFAIFSTDLKLRVTTWNPGAEQILGYAEKEMLGRSSEIIFTPEDRAAGAHAHEATQALAEGRAGDERWHQRKDGSRFFASGALMRMSDASGQAIGFVKILRDVTEARQTRLDLERSREALETALSETENARAEAEAASQAKDHFLAVLSHELRTPLTPVLMAAHLLGRNRDLPASAREALGMIQRNVQIEARFIDELLDITRITRGKLEVVPEPMDLHAAIRGAVEITAGDVQEKGQRLTVELGAHDHHLRGDNHRLQQVFWNLLKNASKFTPDGGSIRLVSRNEPGRVIVEISDTGVGFEAEAATRIFNAFEQASREVTRRFGGLGLGLAISKATVDAHDGSLRAESAGPGRGAVFTVELPLASSPPASPR